MQCGRGQCYAIELREKWLEGEQLAARRAGGQLATQLRTQLGLTRACCI
jgi:hypothetical protein